MIWLASLPFPPLLLGRSRHGGAGVINVIDDDVRRNRYVGTSVIRCWLQSAAMNCSAGSNITIDHDGPTIDRRSSLLAIGHSMAHSSS